MFPARIREISNPRLNAWLNIRRVWNVEMNGNHEKSAIGTKMSIPIPASYKRAMERMDFHNPTFFIRGFQAAAICKSLTVHVRERKVRNSWIENKTSICKQRLKVHYFFFPDTLLRLRCISLKLDGTNRAMQLNLLKELTVLIFTPRNVASKV